MNVGTAQHKAIAAALERDGLLRGNYAASAGPDFSISRLTTQSPFPLEVHPDTTFSFNKHIGRDYPSYLTITTPKIDLARYFELFGKGPR